ncbi:DNA-protecting protein DprA [bacterium]|nr:MAG: DNA-protecting protein DprA [bacterium]
MEYTDSQKNILIISMIKGVGPRSYMKLLGEFGSINQFLEANKGEYSELLASFWKVAKDINLYLDRLSELDVKLTFLGDKDYPSSLASIYDPPLVLYYKGSLEIEVLNFSNLLSIVGSRTLNEYGKRTTKKFGEELANDFTLVSGMAIGADSIVHEASLNANKPTIAVLASSVEKATPLANYHLYDKIIRNGLIVSEYPIGTDPHLGHFPNRNRIVAGLSLGTLVTQARMNSGSLITPRLAIDQGRESFAIPGMITDTYHKGTNWLIQNNIAHMVLEPDDIRSILNIKDNSNKYKSNDIAFENPIQVGIVDKLTSGSLNVDELSILCKFSINDINVNLSVLEMGGFVLRDNVGKYSLA